MIVLPPCLIDSTLWSWAIGAKHVELRLIAKIIISIIAVFQRFSIFLTNFWVFFSIFSIFLWESITFSRSIGPISPSVKKISNGLRMNCYYTFVPKFCNEYCSCLGIVPYVSQNVTFWLLALDSRRFITVLRNEQWSLFFFVLLGYFLNAFIIIVIFNDHLLWVAGQRLMSIFRPSMRNTCNELIAGKPRTSEYNTKHNGPFEQQRCYLLPIWDDNFQCPKFFFLLG